MEAAEKPNRNYLLWTLLTMFAIVGFIGIYKSQENKQQYLEAKAQALAMEGSLIRRTDPTAAYQMGREAMKMDSNNRQAGHLLFDLFFEAPHFPFHEEIGSFWGATTIDCSPNGRFWGIAQDNNLLVLDLNNDSQETFSMPAKVQAIALTDDSDTWAAIDQNRSIQLKHEGKDLEFQLEEGGQFYDLSFSANARYFAAISEESVSIFDLDSTRQIKIDRLPIGVNGESGAFRWLVFDAAETLAAFCMRERDVYVVELETGRTQVLPLETWKDKKQFASSAVFADDIRFNEGQPPALFVGNSTGDAFLEVQLGSGKEATWDPETVDLFVPNSNLQRDIALARLKLNGSTVLNPISNTFFNIREVIWSDAMVGVGITDNGNVVHFDRISKTVQTVYSSPKGILNQAAVLNNGSLVAVDEEGTLRKWAKKGKLFVERRPYNMLPLFSCPDFEGNEVVFLENNGTEYRYQLETGEYTTKRDSTLRGKGENTSPAFKQEAKEWENLTNSTLLSSLSWRNLRRHIEKIEKSVPWQEGQMGEWMYKMSPDGQSVLLALREMDSSRFYNYFAWVPFSPHKIIDILDSGIAGDLSD